MVYQMCMFLQNSAARLTTHTPRYSHITPGPVLLALHYGLPVKFRICYKIAVISFKAIHNLGHAYLSNVINIKRCSNLTLLKTESLDNAIVAF